MRTALCPLCAAPVEGDDVLRDHLEITHDLRDDPGARTSLSDLVSLIPDPEFLETDLQAAPAPTLRVHDPYADDARWQPIAIGLGGVLLLILAVVAISLGG